MKHLITFLLCFFSLITLAQNTNDTTKYFKSYDYGFSYRRLQAREAFIMPTDTVINKLGAVSLNGNIFLGNGIKWTSIGGGLSTDTTSLSNRINLKLNIADTSSMLSKYLRKTDTTSLSNRINLKLNIADTSNMLSKYLRKTDTASLSNRINLSIDSIRRSNDSIFVRKNGTFVFQYKDSVGSPNLQQVTNVGNTTTNAIIVGDVNAENSILFSLGLITKLGNNFTTYGRNNIINSNANPDYSHAFVLPELIEQNGSRYFPISVNGNVADGFGNITLSVVDSIRRSNDSIFARKNGTFVFQYKDSVGGGGDTSSLSNRINLKLNSADTASLSNRINLKLNATDTASLSKRINEKLTNLDLLQSLSYGAKAEPYGITLATVTSQLTLTTTRLNFYPFNWNVSDSVRGIAFLNRGTTTLTQTNYNGVAIYSLSGGTLTRLTFTANNGTFWDGTINTWKSQPITPFFLNKGVYYLGYQMSGSAGVPTIASGQIMQAGLIELPSALNPNGVKISSFITNATTTPPSSIAMSTTTTQQQVPYFILY